MTQRHLLKFIRKMSRKEQSDSEEAPSWNLLEMEASVPLSEVTETSRAYSYLRNGGAVTHNGRRVVYVDRGAVFTLQDVFASLKVDAKHVTVDHLDVHQDKTLFHRFDRFNKKYNPLCDARLRTVFLKIDNLIHGEYYGRITRELIHGLKTDTKYERCEWRVSIYGRHPEEWKRLAVWADRFELITDYNVFVIQLPRLFHRLGSENFEDFLQNVFGPLFDVTQDPSSCPALHHFLKRCVGFDSVDDESLAEVPIAVRQPCDWKQEHGNPPYTYYLYYMWANISQLNTLRRHLSMTEFTLRPHAGEAGSPVHLAAAFLLADNISHGIKLHGTPVLFYLYYLMQVGIAMSPISNNSLFLQYSKSPFYSFFRTGLHVSLSTDDPLQFHFTQHPLMEEYSNAATFWKLSSCDTCEIARNSVLMSSFPPYLKSRWHSDRVSMVGPSSNNVRNTNVPSTRVLYRYERLLEEWYYVSGDHDASFYPATNLSLRDVKVWGSMDRKWLGAGMRPRAARDREHFVQGFSHGDDTVLPCHFTPESYLVTEEWLQISLDAEEGRELPRAALDKVRSLAANTAAAIEEAMLDPESPTASTAHGAE